ncbi:MAG: TPM domain-containing protein [Patescibacteria group bacterium]
MKRALILATILFVSGVSLLHAYTSPGKPQGFVNDFAGVLSAETEAELSTALTAFTQETSMEVAVVTVPTLGDETVETYAVKLFEEWGIGDKDKDTGLLLLVAPTERKVRIEVGYGLEGYMTDAQSFLIVRNILLPAFKANDFDGGVMSAAVTILEILRGNPEAIPKEKSMNIGDLPWEVIIGFGFFGISLLGSVLGRSKSWWFGGLLGATGGVIAGIIWGFLFTGVAMIVILTILGLFFDYIASKHGGKRGPFGPGGFFGGGGGSFGGGFGGFSGGSSGGGGSSGSW